MDVSTCKIELKVKSLERDTLFVPIGRGLLSFHVYSSITGDSKEIEQESLYSLKDKYNNRYLRVNVSSNETIKIIREVKLFPDVPDISPRFCLKNDERFCKWVKGGYIEKIVNQGKALSERDRIVEWGERIREIGYFYPRNKYEYADEVLRKSLPQDCLGMHGVLCAMLRCSGVPAVLDFGFRLDRNNAPHAWLWYFSRELNEWLIVDLNDSPRNVLVGDSVIKPRISISLGTTHEIENHIISFVQYFLSQKKIEGEVKISHESKVVILK